ncbi:MAG: methylaspartate mutase accessory protein GlmL [Fusobacteria bacterium]|nr:methylaspartate mutase accessory protein GlmL [Fusobacteriota bacterium]
MENNLLLIDFGSTYTKLTAIDLINEEIIGTAKDITTVESDILEGYEKALSKLKEKIGCIDFGSHLACSSAAGGLKMIAIGLVPELTAEASKRAALGAGARVIKTYSFELSKREIEEIDSMKLDMILLSGGTDGGNKKCILHNAKLLSQIKNKIPIVVAGNKSALDEIEEILFNYPQVVFTENVMPKLNLINVEPVREEIRKLFFERIIEAKGINKTKSFIENIILPTPAAVLEAAKILAMGSENEEGLGSIIIVDIGGATTDIHSIGKGDPTLDSVNLKGLEEPFAKRTVEGDLGMRYSALSLYEAADKKDIKKYLSGVEVLKECEFRHNTIDFVPLSEHDFKVDEGLAKLATHYSMNRHVGRIETLYTPIGMVMNQIGKDTLEFDYMIGTGGVIVHSKNPESILSAGIFSESEPDILKPKNPKFIIDNHYILSAMGLLAQKYPTSALRMMKKYLKNI